MTATRSIVLAVMVLVGGVTLAVPAAGATVADGLLQEDDGESETSPMGSQVSAFMQSSASVTDESVETEMFVAAFENADNETRTELVEKRAKGLKEKLERLEAERETLRNESDEMSEAQYDARIARLTSQIQSLEKAINATEPRAAAVGVDTAALEEIRTNASKLTGPEVAEAARGIAGVDTPRGPPDDAGPKSDRGDGKEKGAPDRDTGNESNPSEHGPDGEAPPDKSDDASGSDSPGQNEESDPGSGSGSDASPASGDERDSDGSSDDTGDPSGNGPGNA